MKIAIIGSGFTGLAAAQKLTSKGYTVTIFEKEMVAGGLAQGFKAKGWKWPLERHYHHLFTSDNAVLNFAKRLNVPVDFKKPVTSTFIDGASYQIDNPVSLMKFPKLSFIDRTRVGLVILYLKLNPFWESLEGVPAYHFLKSTMGESVWRVLWEPLFKKKFGKDYKKLPASWFWARIKKRSSFLGYPRGGFQWLIDKSVENILKNKGKILFGSEVTQISTHGLVFELTVNGKKYIFDKVICTLPSKPFVKISTGLPNQYKKQLLGLQGIGAVNLVLELDNRFMQDDTYWLNINEMDYPFLCLVEHTNYINKNKYNNRHLLYIGNYLPVSHKYFKKDKNALIKEFLPHLKKINPEFSTSWLKNSYLFKAPFAQPLVTLNYSKRLPDLTTPIEGLYLANIQQVYPWDRGTNYSVELGNKVAELIS
jgi:protoporphyrinogen oxidase